MSRLQSRRQRGSVAVEAALVTPILVLLILGAVHFGKVMMLRHKLAAATDLATRSSAIAKTTNSAQARSVVQTELGASSDLCESLTVTAAPRSALGVDSVEIQTTCTINRSRFSSTLTGFLGPDQLTVRVAMPM
jgi:Flp pilus assembly protein TadG